MPVLDHPVHPSTQHDARELHGCKNRTGFASGYWAPSRKYYPDGRFEAVNVWIPHVMSTGCRSFFLWDSDPACQGCTAPKDHAYADLMRAVSEAAKA